MAIARPIHRLTEAEYLEIERVAEIKSEFFDGEMFAMSGGTRAHSLIATNLAGEFRGKLRGRPCIAYSADLRVKVESAGLFTYPDLSVTCGGERFEDQEKDTLLNPTLIAEVLSESTEAYDRGRKFELYGQIPDLREFLLVSQWEPRIEQFIRQPGGEWLLRHATGLEAQLQLPSLDITIALGEVFAKVEFTPLPLRFGKPRGA